ncbi:MAG TPA: G1 family glutamic endopeptidase [Solirubrobacteraceae bacterium]|nr:G1 family glutamic endopeptidase [Solirubrobacteraceae bacterium]
MNRRLSCLGALQRLTLGLAVSLAACGIAAASASAALTSHGQLLHLAPGLQSNTNSSSNWFGYGQGTLEQGDKLFNSITGDWTVPTATQHTAGQAEDSSDWIGIGGGCIDSGCTATDSTLIQTGTEQDVDSTGAASYSAWWELVPAPSLTISNMTVAPGDHMHASISELVPDSDVWTISIQDVTRGESFSQTVPYSSTHATAEWIEETPLEIGTDAGFAALPNLTNPAFTSGTVNGASAGLKPSEEMDLVDSNGNVIGAPSAPNSAANGFDACAWASTCS